MANDGRNIGFEKEKEVVEDMGKGLENALAEVKETDKQIAKALNHKLSWVSHVPILNRMVEFMTMVKPLSTLESELRGSLNGSLTSLVKIGRKSQEEKERLIQLNEVLETAKNENWGSEQFLEFMENNTDISYVVSVDGEETDLKELFVKVEELMTPEKKAEKQKENIEWLQSHIRLSQQYLDSMYTLVLVGSEWVGGMTRNYFDLTQLRGGMEEIQRALKNLGSGGIAAMSSQKAISLYGVSYVKGMKALVLGYNKMTELKGSGSEDDFRKAITGLEADLTTNLRADQTKAIEEKGKAGQYVLPASKKD